MQRSSSHLTGLLLCICELCLVTHLTACSARAGETDILTITIEKPTQLSKLVYQNTANLMVSRTGVVAVFYPKPRTGPKFYRVSTDRGHTWSPEMKGPPELEGGAHPRSADCEEEGNAVQQPDAPAGACEPVAGIPTA